MAELLQFAPPASAIPDAAERLQALDITRSFIVEAPAGSGKTGLLIQRLLKLLASDTVTDPGQVLAITFTRKATHEMRDRVMEQLAAAREEAEPANAFDRETRPMAKAALERDQRLGWGLLEHPNRLNISTIDAFCIRIASSLPVLSGGGGQTPVEDPSELYAEAARRTLDLLGADDSALVTALELLLLHRDGNLTDCRALIAEMLSLRDQWGDLVPLTGAELTDEHLETVVLPRLEKALDYAICRALTRLDKLMPASLGYELAMLARRMSHAAGHKGAESPLAICRELTSTPGAAAADLDLWRVIAHILVKSSKPRDWRKSLASNTLGFEIEKQHKAELTQMIGQLSGNDALLDALCTLTTLPPPTYPREQWNVAKALFRVLSRALVELQFVFAARRQCDFTESSLLARDALRQATSHDDLAAFAGFNLEHLLVDEMQDTSNGQYDLIRLLTQRWDGGSQTVFLVGDPKQSIYLFRQARVERFIDTLRTGRLGDVPLSSLFLTANFRSQANLVTGFNKTFSRLFPKQTEGTDSEVVPYREAHAVRPGVSGPDLTWHTAVIPYDPDRSVCAAESKRQTRQDAAEIRSLIEAWRARPRSSGKPPKIAVLVRNRRHLLEIVRALKQEPAIAFRAIKTEPLAERQEVLDLLALTRALLHPADRTAWLALLRTPWCGLTLSDLHRLTGSDDERWRHQTVLTLIEKRGELLSSDAIERLEPFWTIMKSALAQRDHMPLSQWVERTWRAFGAHAFATPEELANTSRFLQLLDQMQASGNLTIGRLSQRIRDLYAAESTAPDAVDLMTIHNAKGLEWDFVCVPSLEGSSGVSTSRLLSWLEIESGGDAAHGIVAAVQPRGEPSYALTRWMRSIHSAREAAERERLFYVACTRAREELHLFGHPSRRKDGTLGQRYDSLLKAAWQAAREHISERAELAGLDIAASGISLVPPSSTPARTIGRIPLSALLPATLGSPTPVTETRGFQRPEGSFNARAFGNAMHTFLELLARRMASGSAASALLQELPGWTPRITAILRSSGLAPTEVTRAAANVSHGLARTLEDPEGRWILAPHPQASSETTLVSPAGIIRLDRTFLAGATPQTEAESHLWIIDFKTGTHGAEGLNAFLAREREKYAPQLETYANHLAARDLPIRLALYYPTLAKLLWWPSS